MENNTGWSMFSFPFVSITVRFLSFRALSLHDYSFFVETLIMRFRIPGQSLFETDILVWYETKFCQEIRCNFWNCDRINEQLIVYIRATLFLDWFKMYQTLEEKENERVWILLYPSAQAVVPAEPHRRQEQTTLFHLSKQKISQQREKPL